jgi:hypothetical protein
VTFIVVTSETVRKIKDICCEDIGTMLKTALRHKEN